MAKADLTAQQVRELFDFNSESGELRWKKSIPGGLNGNATRAKAGSLAGCINKLGYRQICIGGSAYRAHRLVWLLAYGEWPALHIDHINGDKSDNRLQNLRLCTDSENGQNRKTSATYGGKAKSSPLIGACFCKKRGMWLASIRINGQYKHLGYFSSDIEAHLKYAEAKKIHHRFNPSLAHSPSPALKPL